MNNAFCDAVLTETHICICLYMYWDVPASLKKKPLQSFHKRSRVKNILLTFFCFCNIGVVVRFFSYWCIVGTSVVLCRTCNI